MTERPSQSETQMLFLPGERIQELLFDVLAPFVVSRLMSDGNEIGFRSKNSYVHANNVEDMTLRRLKKKSDGLHVPIYPLVALRAWSYPGADDEPKHGLAIEIAMDLNDQEYASDARMLGFADTQNLVISRLALQREQLHWPRGGGKGPYERTQLLKEAIESASPPEEARVSFVQNGMSG